MNKKNNNIILKNKILTSLNIPYSFNIKMEKFFNIEDTKFNIYNNYEVYLMKKYNENNETFQ